MDCLAAFHIRIYAFKPNYAQLKAYVKYEQLKNRWEILVIPHTSYTKTASDFLNSTHHIFIFNSKQSKRSGHKYIDNEKLKIKIFTAPLPPSPLRAMQDTALPGDDHCYQKEAGVEKTQSC